MIVFKDKSRFLSELSHHLESERRHDVSAERRRTTNTQQVHLKLQSEPGPDVKVVLIPGLFPAPPDPTVPELQG